MIAQRHSIFRDKALKHYTQGRKKDVLPNFSSIPVAIFFWLLLGSLLATALVFWYVQVPVYLTAPGIMLGQGNAAQSAGNGATALVFFSPSASAQVQVGQPAQVQVSASNSSLNGVIVQVQPGTTNLAAALEHYGLGSGGANSASLASQQVVVALLRLSAGVPATLYTGSPLAVEIHVGSQSLFSALTGIQIS